MKTYKILILFAVIPILNINMLQSQINTANDVVKIIETQMLLSQKAAKDYFIIGINCCESTTAKAAAELKETKVQFEKNQRDLTDYINIHQENLKSEIENISMFWQLYKEILCSSPDVYSASSLIDINSDMINDYESMIEVFKEQSIDYDENHIVNICRRQSILTQQIAMLYVGNIWGVSGEKNIKKEYTKSKDKFKKSLKTISLNEENTEDINNNITTAKGLFKYDNKEFDLKKDYVAEVFDITYKLSEKMNDITEMYENIYSI